MFIFYEQLNHSNMNSDMGKKLWDRIIEIKQTNFSRHRKALGVNMRIEKFTLVRQSRLQKWIWATP